MNCSHGRNPPRTCALAPRFPWHPLSTILNALLPCFNRHKDGWNTAALWAIFIGVLPTLPGFLTTIGAVSGLPPIFAHLYDCSWFVGVAVSSVVYCLLMHGAPGAYQAGEGSQAWGGSGSSGNGGPASFPEGAGFSG